MRRLFLFVLILPITAFPLFGENMWQSHGHNYSYSSYSFPDEEKVIFPVAWDVRSANNLIMAWQNIYGISGSNPVLSILEESREFGFNTAIIRSELADKWFPDQTGAAGDLIGFFAFDEPDVKYLENPDQSAEWLEFVSCWNDICRTELNLPVLCYFAKYADATPDGQLVYYTDTTTVLNRMARFTDMVGIDMYPVKNNFRRTDLLRSETDQAAMSGRWLSAALSTAAELLYNEGRYRETSDLVDVA